MADRLFDRWRTLVGNVVFWDASPGQSHDHLVVMPTNYVPLVATECMHQVLSDQADIDVMSQ